MITDNLASLFVNGPEGVGFRQGRVVAWNPNTGANTIEVAGGMLTDVSVLNSGEAIALKAGHIVGLLTYGGAWFILGRITSPGDPNFAGASVAFASASAAADGFALSIGGPATVATAVIPVPTWADEALVTVSAAFSLHNTRTASDWAAGFCYVGSDAGSSTLQGFAAASDAGKSDWGSLSCAHQVRLTAVGGPITVTARVSSNDANWPADALNRVRLVSSAIFRSTV